jgi:hypothetical protein
MRCWLFLSAIGSLIFAANVFAVEPVAVQYGSRDLFSLPFKDGS